MNKKLTIIIPIYNTEKYLQECLESIANQNYKNIEVICVDDGSTDDSVQIVESFIAKDSRFNLIKAEHNGVSYARNLGLENATGEYVTFVDSDDKIEQETYSEALKHIEKVDFVCFKIKVFGENLHKNRNAENKYYNFKFKGLKQTNEKVLKKLDVSLCNKIFKISLIKEKNISFPNGLHYEDANFYWKYMLNSRTGYFIQKYFYNYRRREKSIMAESLSKVSKSIDHLLILEDLFSYLKKEDLLKINLNLCAYLLEHYFRFVVRLTPKGEFEKVFEKTYEYARFLEEQSAKSKFINKVIERKFIEVLDFDYKFSEKFFSLKNDVTKEYKIITILGMKIRIKRNA